MARSLLGEQFQAGGQVLAGGAVHYWSSLGILLFVLLLFVCLFLAGLAGLFTGLFCPSYNCTPAIKDLPEGLVDILKVNICINSSYTSKLIPVSDKGGVVVGGALCIRRSG